VKIYDFEGFPNPARVRIALAEKAATDKVTFVHVDVPKGEHRLPDFVRMNPSAVVPVLELDDGTTISECRAITEYIDHACEGISLTGKLGKERAVVHMTQRRAEQGMLDAVGTYFHHATPGLGALELCQNKEWGMKQHARALDGMHYFDSVLATQPFAVGENFAKVEIPSGLFHLLAWRARMATHPSLGG
jgi:glutathione S-transferase